ncbi:hypothetical protein [Aquimarina sp. RZ0]|uniref:hypothetical protein n=1 Tax=Aquimarina sp. RZ0 TaxID=2607730 RepID=UPI0011F0C565|nr:hypothetical protein [Aquimarina sp. RZ0]KAA1244274.1 hypothetical protein F0000_17285 [Aquimarina sp. RZ0]
MNNNYIEFKKKRELGDILKDVFAFLRTNIKPLFSILFRTTGFSFAILIIAVGYYTHQSSNILDLFNIGGNTQIFTSANFIVSLFFMFASTVLFYGLVFGTILHYIRVYIQGNGIIDQSMIIEGVKKNFGKIIGLSILSTLITSFGFLLCFIPGIYFYVPMSLVFSILVFRNIGVFDSISESFELIKNEWWITFATLLVILILAYIISMVFSIPAIIYMFFKTFTAATEGTLSDPSTMLDWISVTLSTLASVLQYIIIYLLTAISSAFIYYNINERKNHTGTLEQIDALGKSE